MKKLISIVIAAALVLLLPFSPACTAADGAIHIEEEARLAVFVGGENCSDSNSGLRVDTAVATLDRAYEILLSLNDGAISHDSEKCGTINVCGTVEINNNFNINRNILHEGTVKIIGIGGKAVLRFSGAGEQAIQLGGPTFLNHITLDRAAGSAYTIYTVGSLKIGDNVVSQFNGTLTNKGITNADMQGKCIIRGGYYNAPYTGDISISIASGTYWFVSGANATANGSVTGNVSIALSGTAWAATIVPGTQAASSNISTSMIQISGDAYVNCLAGSGDSGIIENSVITVTGGTVNEFLTTRPGKTGTITNLALDIRSGNCATDIPIVAAQRKISLSNMNCAITSVLPWDEVTLLDHSTVELGGGVSVGANATVARGSVLRLAATSTLTRWNGCGEVCFGGESRMNPHMWDENGICTSCHVNRYIVFADETALTTGDGYSADLPVESLVDAYETLLSGNGNTLASDAASNGEIIISGVVTVDGNHFNLAGSYEHMGTVKITSVHDAVDYRANNSAALCFGSKGNESQIRFQCGGPTIFDDIVINRLNREDGSAGASLTIYAAEQLLIGENVETRNTNWIKVPALTPEQAKNVKLSSHMGYHENAPANSKPAFIQAGQLGYWAIETDVYTTKDGVLVCCHDNTIDAMYNGTGKISDMTYQELLQYKIDAGNGLSQYTDEELRMPSFSEYLTICAQYGALPFIEIKAANVEAVINEAKEYFDEKDIIISSANFLHLRQARAVSADVFIHHIFSDASYMDSLASLGNAGMAFNYTYTQLIDAGTYTAVQTLIRTAHEKNIQVCLRAGDNNEAVSLMLTLGVDYIPTNTSTPASIVSAGYMPNNGGKIFIRGGYGYKAASNPVNITVQSGAFDFVAASNAEYACSGNSSIHVGGAAFVGRLVMGVTHNGNSTIAASTCSVSDDAEIRTLYAVGDYGNVLDTRIFINGGTVGSVLGRRNNMNGTAQDILLDIANENLRPETIELSAPYITGSVSITVNGTSDTD